MTPGQFSLRVFLNESLLNGHVGFNNETVLLENKLPISAVKELYREILNDLNIVLFAPESLFFAVIAINLKVFSR